MFNLIEPQAIDWGVAWPALAGIAYLVAMSPALTTIDLRERRLPNRLVLPALPITMAGQAVAAALDASLWSRIAATLIAALLVFAFALFANVKGQLGMGDAKLMTAMTLSLGWFSPIAPFVAMLAGFVVAGGFVLVQTARMRTALSHRIPLGPYLLLGNLVGLASIFVL